MICKVCNIDKPESEMKTKTKCMCCHRKYHAEYMRKFISKKEKKEKKKERSKNYYSFPENKEKRSFLAYTTYIKR